LELNVYKYRTEIFEEGYLKNKIALYKKKGWHSDIVDAYEKYINGDSSSKDIIEKHYEGKTIIWEGSTFDNYLSKYATNKTK
jgi:hypothetical protein